MVITKVERVKSYGRFGVEEVMFVYVADDEVENIGVRTFYTTYGALKFASLCVEISEALADVCEHCKGDGEVSCYESVWTGEPHQALVGTRKCICQYE